METKYNKDLLESHAKKCNSIREMLDCFNLKYAGGNYKHIRNLLHYYKIDISHFNGKNWAKGLILKNKRKYQTTDLLKNDTLYPSNSLKKRLLSENYKQYICECCLNVEWNGQKIPLELHHKDGNHLNNLLENLMLLCPNCHALTENYKNKNKIIKPNYKLDIKEYETKKEKKCVNCDKILISKNKSYCDIACYNMYRFSIRIPDRNQLIVDIDNLKSNIQIGKKYGVSDNTIKKWKTKYNL